MFLFCLRNSGESVCDRECGVNKGGRERNCWEI